MEASFKSRDVTRKMEVERERTTKKSDRQVHG